MFRPRVACLVILGVLAPASASAFDNTVTGFCYPTGTSQLGVYAGWLAVPPAYNDNLYHLGKDIAAEEGDPVYAIDDGDVYHISYNGWGEGNVALLIRHKLADGTVFLAIYGHITSNLSVGSNVVGGQVIGVIGDYDLISVDHLHFGIRPGTSTAGPLGRDALANYPDPHGLVDPINWITTRDPGVTLFADAFTRNGGRDTVGDETGLVYVYGPYIRQDFAGGTFGNCCIMYDPNNAVGNPQATNEAYLLRTAFYEHYLANGGWDAFGCPSRDEYHPVEGAPGDAIQFFFRPRPGDIPFHYMYFNPPNIVSWHSSYATNWVAQDPASEIMMGRGERRTFTVQFRNTGTTTWYKDAQAYPYDAIELKSCSSDGSIVASFLNNPYDAGLGWLDAETPCTMQETSVSPGGTATFSFQGRIPPTAPLGVTPIYFRPKHSLAGLIQNWDGMHFVVNVVPALPPFALILRNPSTGNWYTRVSNGSSFAYPSGPNWPADLWLSGWAAEDAGYTFTPFVGDANGDRYDDLIVRRNDAAWYAAWNNANGSFTPQGAPLMAQWGTGDYAGRYTFLFANVDTDPSDELITYDAQNANWYVSQFDPSTNSYLPGALWETWGGGIGVFQALAGDFSGDGKADICLLTLATGNWWVRLSTGSDFIQPSPDNWCPYWIGSGYQPLTGDWSGDGKCDIALLDPATGNWWVRLSTGSSFTQPSPDNWCPAWYGSGYLPFVGDFDQDQDTDIGLRNPTLGDHWVRLSAGSAFVQPSPDNWHGGWGASSVFQLLVGNFGGGLQGKRGDGEGPDVRDPLTPYSETSVPTPTFSIQPNPVLSATTFSYVLPGDSCVVLRLYNPAGRLVATLLNEEQPAGAYNLPLQNVHLPSGVYFLQLQAGEKTQTQRLLLLR